MMADQERQDYASPEDELIALILNRIKYLTSERQWSIL